MSGKKIIAVSASYPPDHAGGYELRVKDVMDGLANLGNNIVVLTTETDHKVKSESEESPYPIKRILHNRYKAKRFPKELWQDLLDTRTLEREICRFNPDLIYLGHIYPLTKQLLPFLSTLDIPVLCDEGGNSLKGAWTDHGRWFEFAGDYRSRFQLLNLIKPAVIRLVLWISGGRIMRAWSHPNKMTMIFNSELNRRNATSFGVPTVNSQVIHSGVDIDKFTFRLKDALSDPVKILIPGRIETKKGQLDAVRLLHELHIYGMESELFLVGPSSVDGYADVVKNEMDKLNLAKRVHFVPMVNQDQMVELYHHADICFFSSYHQTGFSRVPLEAMACGCVVVSYGNEGSDEVICHEENGFLVAPGDLNHICLILKVLKNSEHSLTTIVQNARMTIEAKHSMDRYISSIEEYIHRAVNS